MPMRAMKTSKTAMLSLFLPRNSVKAFISRSQVSRTFRSVVHLSAFCVTTHTEESSCLSVQLPAPTRRRASARRRVKIWVGIKVSPPKRARQFLYPVLSDPSFCKRCDHLKIVLSHKPSPCIVADGAEAIDFGKNQADDGKEALKVRLLV